MSRDPKDLQTVDGDERAGQMPPLSGGGVFHFVQDQVQILDHVLVVLAVTQTPGVEEVKGRLPHRLWVYFSVLRSMWGFVCGYLRTGEFSHLLSELPPPTSQLDRRGQDDGVLDELSDDAQRVHPQQARQEFV